MALMLTLMLTLGAGRIAPVSAANDAAAQSHQALVQLQRATDGASLAAAALLARGAAQSAADASRALQDFLVPGRAASLSMALIARAAAAAPESAEIAWLQVTLCQATPGCDSTRFEQQLRSLDPANGASAFAAMERAHRAHGEAAISRAMHDLADSKQLDLYWSGLTHDLGFAVVRTGKMPANQALIEVIGRLAALSIPPYEVVSSWCHGEHLTQGDSQSVCRKVAASMQNGDIYLTQGVGIGIAKRAWPEDSPEWRAAARARRLMDYELTVLGKVQPLRQSDVDAERYLALYGKFRRENDVTRARIVAAGYAPDPPDTP